MFLSLDGFTILTDPVFSAKIGINFGPMTIGLKRLVAPAVPFAEFPRPDLILLSHAHMDHFDIPSLRELEHPRVGCVDGVEDQRSAAGRQLSARCTN